MSDMGKIIPIIVLVAALSIGAGFFIGRTYSPGGEGPVGKERATPEEAKKSVEAVGLENKVVKFISKSVGGTVKSISGQKVVLAANGDTLSFTVSENARVNRLTVPSPKPLEAPLLREEGAPTPEAAPAAEPVREELNLSQVKVGDKVDAILNSQPDGSFVAVDVTVMVEKE